MIFRRLTRSVNWNLGQTPVVKHIDKKHKKFFNLKWKIGNFHVLPLLPFLATE